MGLSGRLQSGWHRLDAWPYLYKDPVFTAKDWAAHRNWIRTLPEVLPLLRALRFLFFPVAVQVGIACLVGIYHSVLQLHGAPNLTDRPNIYIAFQLVSFALALLLVFRTNSSYGRWYEGRQQWGRSVAACRNLLRQGLAWSSASQDRVWQRALARWVAFLPRALRSYLREDTTIIRADMKAMLLPHEAEWLAAWKDPRAGAAQMVSVVIAQATMPEYYRVSLDACLAEWMYLAGRCEAIENQPIPYAYTRQLLRFLMVWLSFLPFALWPFFGWVTPGVQAVISFLLLGVENIGVQIEQPFECLPMDAWCEGVSGYVQDLMACGTDSAERVVNASLHPPSQAQHSPDPLAAQAGAAPHPPQQMHMASKGLSTPYLSPSSSSSALLRHQPDQLATSDGKALEVDKLLGVGRHSCGV